jgi:methionyl-tRNA formyltransferase
MKKKNDLRIGFFGTPHFAVYVLEELEKANITPSLLITVPDKPADRGLELRASPVKEWALEKECDLIQPEKLDASDPEGEMMLNSEWDLFIVAGYGKFLPKDLLALPAHGTVNVHPSLLPKFRGPSPIESQILADSREVGVSVILLDEETDHGPILAQAAITPEPWPFRRSDLENLLWHEGGTLLAETIPSWLNGEITPEPQKHENATFTPKLKKEDGLLDLAGDGYQNYLKFCAYEGWPGTYFFMERGGKKVRVKIADAAYEDGKFIPARVIPEGKKEMSYQDFLRV